jgi:hypothetical protein
VVCLNDGVVTNVHTIQHHAGCTNDVTINPQLRLAAQWHTEDVLTNAALNGDSVQTGRRCRVVLTPPGSREAQRRPLRSTPPWRSLASRS